MKITKNYLPENEYYPLKCAKKQIVIHHTAGGGSALNTRQTWIDGKRVATAYIIGGKHPFAYDTVKDGNVLQVFDDAHWAHHIGLSRYNNTPLNQASLAVEVCNFGILSKTPDGRFLTYVKTEIAQNEVIVLDKPFRGSVYYQLYSDAQIEALRELILMLCEKYNIPRTFNGKKDGITAADFELSAKAINGESGIFTHANYLISKSDMSPQPKLVEMLNSL